MSPQTYISVAASPGRFGATVYGELISRRGINAVYIPRFAPSSASDLVSLIRSEHIHGCSVSMPMKSAVVPLLDHACPLVVSTSACNTIVRKGADLYGFNTDIHGLEFALSQLKSPRTALIHGYGAVVNSIVLALRGMGTKEIFLTGRRMQRAAEKARILRVFTYAEPGIQKFDLVINATPVDDKATAQAILADAHAVFDLLVRPKATLLVRMAEEKGIPAIPGVNMAIGQLREQFFHYFGERPGYSEIEGIVREKYLA